MAKDNSELIDVNSDVKDRVMEVSHIQSLIYVIRGKQVMLDSDLAILYQVETKTFNQAVKRNIERFPENFRFQLKKEGRGGRRYLPYVFTEQGIAMLSAVLRSDIAIQVSIRISSVSDTAGRICNTVSRLLIADEFDNPEKTSCKVVRVGLLLFGYSYIMYCVEYYPCGGAV